MDLIKQDIEKLYTFDHIDLNKLKRKTILVTGATGLIGTSLVKTLLYLNAAHSLELTVLAMIRSQKKANRVFEDYSKDDALKYVLAADGIENCKDISADIDYIVHGANPTSSKFFVNNPVETIETAMNGTYAILNIAKDKNVDGIVFLSTMEVYGFPQKGTKVTESMVGGFDTTVARNCYPLSKQLCENLCCSFYKEYGVPVKIARLTQTFGPGVEYNDGRVFAEFARCAIEHRDIVLKTKGETERCYLYTLDAVSAILTILTNGENGTAYTVANEDTYCSIYEMAKMVADEYGINVVIEEQDVTVQGYANTLYMKLDTGKLKSLGWSPKVDLKNMYKKMIASIEMGR